MKRWSFNKVKDALEHIVSKLESEDPESIDYFVYHLGGSLCIDFKFYPSVILNRNGRGLFFGFKDAGPTISQVKFVMTNPMLSKVKRIYDLTTGKHKATEQPKHHESSTNWAPNVH